VNLHQIASKAIRIINENKTVLYYKSIGYNFGYAAVQQPLYADPKEIIIQRQAAGAGDIEHTKGVNIQSLVFHIYSLEDLQAVNRPVGTGGDLIVMDGYTWLVERIIENWGKWTKAAIYLQVPE
jgi:hypothetical protein